MVFEFLSPEKTGRDMYVKYPLFFVKLPTEYIKSQPASTSIKML